MQTQTTVSELPQIKQMLYAMRNGIIADTLRKQGAPFRMIYGLNLPQLTEIAGRITHDTTTAQALWDDNGIRECMLLAPMVYPADRIDMPTATAWLRQAPSPEVADILCHKLLRHTPFAYELAQSLINDESELIRYGALRLMFNLLPAHVEDIRSYAQTELDRNVPTTRYIATSLLDEIAFITE